MEEILMRLAIAAILLGQSIIVFLTYWLILRDEDDKQQIIQLLLFFLYSTLLTNGNKMWKTYINGNYFVSINLNDGTKIRYNNEDSLVPENVENIDLKITNRCSDGCAFCHEGSCPSGKHADLLHLDFLDTMLPYTEISIGGGDVFTHPDLLKFLYLLQEKKLIANITVSQNSFMRNYDKIKYLIENKLIYAVGISVKSVWDTDFQSKLTNFYNNVTKNFVLHVINGIISIGELAELSFQGYKILILGYKNFRNGNSYYNNEWISIDGKKKALYNYLDRIIKNNWFTAVSFDNLAIEQLEPQKLMSEEDWNTMYLGDDGFASMYVDAVNRQFARSSVSKKRYSLLKDMPQMHKIILAE